MRTNGRTPKLAPFTTHCDNCRKSGCSSNSAFRQLRPPRPERNMRSAILAKLNSWRFLERALTQPDPRPDMFCAGLVLMSALPREQVLSYLRARVAILNQRRVNVDRANSEANFEGEKALPPHVDALLNFWVEHTASGLHWVEELVSKIEGGAYVFADDDPRAFGTPSSLATTAII